MLVLSRRVNESVKLLIPPCAVAQTVAVRVVGFKGQAARLGFEAPEQIGIYRDELEQAGPGLYDQEPSPSQNTLRGR